MRRRHRDNLRPRKTARRYAVASRPAAVSGLGACLVVASYKENPRVKLLPGQSADWYAYHRSPPRPRKQKCWVPQRWHGKVLACTDTRASARQVVEWYEVRWQIELYFRELKSRLQFGCYVLQRFEAVERYVDLLLTGMLLLEHERLCALRGKRRGPQVGEANVQERATDRLRSLEEQCQQWNVVVLEEALRTERGRRRFFQRLRRGIAGHVA
jgi:Transposase DDE domain